MTILTVLILSLSALAAAAIVIIAVRTVGFRSRQVTVEPAEAMQLPAAEIVDRLSRALQIPSVSHDDPSEIDYQAFRDFHRFLAAEYPGVTRTLKRTVINGYSLLYEWPGTDPALSPVVLTAHMDTVPVDRDRWQVDPFSGQVIDGYVWGRGALDDKGSLLSILEAAERLIGHGYVPRRTIYLGFGHDEERGTPAGIDGAKKIAGFLAERGVHAAAAIDEGAILDVWASPVKGKRVALIGINQKGYVSIRLSASAAGGHAMAPPLDHSSVIEQLSRAIIALERHQFPLQIDPSIGYLFDYIGPESPAARRAVFANRWLFRRLILAMLSRTDAGAALLRTTIAPTLIHAGTKEQSLPESGHAVVNFRTMPGQTSAGLLASVRATLKGHPVTAELAGTVHEATPMSRISSRNFEILAKTIRETYPDAVVAPVLAPGRADAEYYYRIADDVYLFAPYQYSPALIESVHGHNERIPVDDYLAMVRFYLRLIENFDQQPPPQTEPISDRKPVAALSPDPQPASEPASRETGACGQELRSGEADED